MGIHTWNARLFFAGATIHLSFYLIFITIAPPDICVLKLIIEALEIVPNLIDSRTRASKSHAETSMLLTFMTFKILRLSF